MSSPIIWIIFPFGLAIILFFLNHHPRLSSWIATVGCALLAISAGVFTIEFPFRIANITVEISSSLAILGRRMVLESGDQGFLVMIYSLGSVWFLGTRAAHPGRYFNSLGLAILAFLVAARSVEPFLFAALLVEMAVLISIPMLLPEGKPAGNGTLRYLIFQTLALPFILLAGWVFQTIEINPANDSLYLQAALLLGLGFSLWLAVFPFSTWAPMLSDESHPYTVGFVLSVLPTIVLFYSLDFLNAYTWLRTEALLPDVLQVTGTLMVVLGGVGAAFQQKLQRAYSYAAILETGFALLAISLGTELGLQVFAAAFLPRLLSLWLWATILSVMKTSNTPLIIPGISNYFRKAPLLAVGLVISWLSVAGLPLLASFPVRIALFEGLAEQSLWFTLWALIGSIGLILGALRITAVMTQSSTESPVETISLAWESKVIIFIGSIVIVLIGVFPNTFLQGLASLVKSFTNLP